MHKPALTLLSLAVVSSSQAAVLTVTSTADDMNPGCLRWCIEHAQHGDEIQFDPALDGQEGGRLSLADSAVQDNHAEIAGPPEDSAAGGIYVRAGESAPCAEAAESR